MEGGEVDVQQEGGVGEDVGQALSRNFPELSSKLARALRGSSV